MEEFCVVEEIWTKVLLSLAWITSWSCLFLQLLSCVWLFATPRTGAHQATLSMGSPRQERWSGLPFPSPRGSSQIRDQTCVSCVDRRILYTGPPVTQSSLTLCNPMDCTVDGILQGRNSPFLSLGDLPNPGTEPRSPALQADSLSAEPQGKPTIKLI